MRRGRSIGGRAAAMAATVLVILVGFAWAGPPAHACSCTITRTPTLREHFDTSAVAVEGHVTGQHFDFGGPGPFDDMRVYTFAVDRVVKGAVGPTLELKTGTNGGTCGISVPIGPIAVVATPAADGSIGVGDCEQDVISVEQLGALEGDLPAEDGRGPPAALVTMQLGDVTMASTDLYGHVIHFGTDPDIGDTLAACPGGTTVLALRRPRMLGEQTELQVIDVPTVRVRSRGTIDGLDGPESPIFTQRQYTLDCLDPQGRAAVFGKTEITYSGAPDFHTTVTRSVVIEHEGTITQTVEGVTAPTYDVTRNRVIAFRDGPPATVVGIDLPADGTAGAVTDLVGLPDANRPALTPISPDGRRVAVPHLATDPANGTPTVDRVDLLDLDLGTSTGDIALPSQPAVSRMRWLTDTTLSVSDFIHPPTMFDVDGTILPPAPNQNVWWTLVGERFWGFGHDRPGHAALEMTPMTGGLSQFRLSGAEIYAVVALHPPVVVVVTAAPPVSANPAFTG